MAKGGRVAAKDDGIAADDADIFENASAAIKKSGMGGDEMKPESVKDRVRRHMKESDFMSDEITQAAPTHEDSAESMVRRGYADGGEVEKDADMIARIMHKRKEYSEGGMVANDVGVAEADTLPAEYDDLVLDDHLEDDSGPGNEKGMDVISKVLSKRKK